MSLDEIRKTKIKKVEDLKKAGINPYPAVSSRTHSIVEVLEQYDQLKEKDSVTLAGRMIARRGHGGSIFFDIFDGSYGLGKIEGRIQGYIKEDTIKGGEEAFERFNELIDVGDFIEVTGILKDTKKGEKTIYADQYNLLSKALLPLPEKWHGIQDVEERYRKRYLDLIFNEDVKNKFLMRFKILDLIRDYFKKNDFIEVETPILQVLAGGATARPFKTHMNDLDMDLYLRVAPELYLKRLLVGGFNRVFEIARNFRNEGTDREHNPEFDMLEAYASYKDYNWMMGFVEGLVQSLVKDLFNKDEFKHEEKIISVGEKFETIKFNYLIKQYTELDYDKDNQEAFLKKAEEYKIDINKSMAKANIADEIFKKIVRPKIINPTFITELPLEISPLSKRIPDSDSRVERFQFLMGGMELMNAFSELNDPQDQRERFQNQEKLRQEGDDEAQRMDEDFIEALEYGMPPAAGIGIGIDRLITLLTNSHTIREVLLFPLMKPR
jgi:lysyl-tRNA synthetase, class II